MVSRSLPSVDALAPNLPIGGRGCRPRSAPAAFFTALGYCLFAWRHPRVYARGSEAPQPRIRHLRRMAILTSAYSLVATAVVAFLIGSLVPPKSVELADTPVVGPLQLRAPTWL